MAILAEDIPAMVQKFCDQHWGDRNAAVELQRAARAAGLKVPKPRKPRAKATQGAVQKTAVGKQQQRRRRSNKQ